MTIVYLAALVLLLPVLFALFAPGFLLSEDIPAQADAVVLFVGPGNEARLDEAKALIKEGHARYLIIPSSGELFAVAPGSGLVKISGNRLPGKSVHGKRIVPVYKKYLENTHVEALEARRIMAELGLRSAVLVSSPYHMRRIRLIADRVFNPDQFTFYCKPVRWQSGFMVSDWLNKERRRIIVSEYVKMGWLLVYGCCSE